MKLALKSINPEAKKNIVRNSKKEYSNGANIGLRGTTGYTKRNFKL